MSIKRYAAKRDANEKTIVDALRDGGATIFYLNKPLDLLIGYRGRTYLAEVKNPEHKKGKATGGLTPAQIEFIADWPGNTPPVLETPDQATAWLAAIDAGMDRGRVA